ncbi:MAG: hypothetical protein H5T97_10680 [Firmicutes bacterium]|nr:hypothetical protein [Bacillota bacterium]
MREPEAELLEGIEDVIAVRVLKDGEGNVSAVHVLAGGGRPAEAVKRDVVTALMARYGRTGDVYVTQLEYDPGKRGRLPVGPRLAGYVLTRRGPQAEARVEVITDQGTHSGTAAGVASRANLRRLLARAALAAGVQELPGTREWEVEEVLVLPVAGHEVVVVLATAVGPGGEQAFAASAVVERDEGEAICQAALELVRRWCAV